MKYNILVISPWDKYWSMGPNTGTGAYYYTLEVLAKSFNLALFKPNSNVADEEFNTISIPYQPIHLHSTLTPIQNGLNQFQLLCCAQKILNYAKFIKPDVIYGFSLLSAPLLAYLGKRLQVPTILRLFGLYRMSEGLRNPIAGIYSLPDYLGFSSKFDKIIISDDGSGDFFLNHLASKKLATILHVPDGYSDSINLLKQPSIKSNVILWAGRMVEYRHPERILYAIKNTKQRWEVIYVGDGEFLAKLKTISHQLALNSQVKFTGALLYNELINLMNTTIVSIACADNFNTTNFILDSFAYGKVIISLSQGTSEFMQSGYNCLLVDKPQQFTDALDWISDNPELAQTLSLNAKLTAMSNLWSWQDRLAWEMNLITNIIECNKR
jgi:glycosyltransferase involved in cell wall biosynthesis